MAEQPTRRSLFSGVIEALRRLFVKITEPEDPYAHRLAPIRGGPNSRSGAAAVAEPEEEHGFFPPRKQP